MELGTGPRSRTQVVRSALMMLALASGTLPAFAAHARGKDCGPSGALPIVFVHGGAGSGVQYSSVARRFVSNGYPADRIRTFEYDSSDGAAVAAAPDNLDAFIDEVRKEYRVGRVNLVGHSLGTTVSTNYLSNPLHPERPAKIARYVGVDGRPILDCKALDPQLECMGIFRGMRPASDQQNVYFNSTQSHVEAATSPESFAAQFKFFTGDEPETTLILPEPPGQVEIAGRAVNFPQNTGVDGGTLRIWEVDPLTGERSHRHPVATIHLGPSGAWGPVHINGQRHYEFELKRLDSSTVLHLYFQPFIRDDHWIRLLSSGPTSPTTLNTKTGPNHAAAVVIRNREWWTTHFSGNQDTLWISTTSASRGDEPAVNALKNVVSDGIAVGLSPVGIHVHDNPVDEMSSLLLIPFFAGPPPQAFQTGVDVYMPATEPPDGTITFWNAPRGDTSRPQVLNTPNWASDRHRISINLHDYVQDINTWGECKRAKPSPCKEK